MVNKMKQNYDQQTKQMNSKLTLTNDEMNKKTSEMLQNMHELNLKVRSIEQEIQFDKPLSKHF